MRAGGKVAENVLAKPFSYRAVTLGYIHVRTLSGTSKSSNQKSLLITQINRIPVIPVKHWQPQQFLPWLP